MTSQIRSSDGTIIFLELPYSTDSTMTPLFDIFVILFYNINHERQSPKGELL